MSIHLALLPGARRPGRCGARPAGRCFRSGAAGYCRQVTARGFDGRSRHRIGRGERRRVMRVGPDFLGLSFALFFLTWSMGPSLLPRGWVVQGVVSGLADATGYGVGLALAFPVRRWVVPKFSGWSPPPRRVERVLQLLVVAGAAAMAAGAAVTAADRRRDLAVLVEMPSSTTVPDVRTALLAAAVFGSVLVVARGLATAARGMGELLRVRAHLPAVVAHAAAPLGLWLAVVLVVDVVVRAGSSDPAPVSSAPRTMVPRRAWCHRG
ncbi:hypothetical protein CQZ88_06845 [Rhodococcus sp. ENV425]|nr:hypothetical protein CQZ88_06845 [Rhodococcus sp. ENV425]